MSDAERARFEVLLERIETRIEILVEGQSTLVANFGGLARNVGILSATVDRLVDGQAALTARVGTIDTRVGNIETRVGNIETDMHAVKDHLGLNGTARTARRIAAKRPAKPRK
ncbi:MAG: hypothetical protein EXR72_01795 [Myxococcales bacterium]|nr:hypothetical protein [Myxococcales bacterium]